MKATAPDRKRYSLLGLSINAFTAEELIREVVQSIDSGKLNAIFGNHNLHSLYLYHKYPELREFHARSYLAHIDGMSLILLGRLIGLPLERAHRTTYLDWIEEFLTVVEARRWKIFVLGGSEEDSARLPATLGERYKLRIQTHHGFVAAGDARVLQQIREFEPDILMVGMGMPAQERWILRELPSLRVPAIFNCGAAFEYLTGTKSRPPRWTGRVGLEWLFRLASEPRRLAARYFIEPMYLMPLLARAVWQRASRNF